MNSVVLSFQVRDLSVAYLLVGLTYLYVGVLIFSAFPSPPLSKDCIEPVRLFTSLLKREGFIINDRNWTTQVKVLRHGGEQSGSYSPLL
jgi:hypothetical protein